MHCSAMNDISVRSLLISHLFRMYCILHTGFALIKTHINQNALKWKPTEIVDLNYQILDTFQTIVTKYHILFAIAYKDQEVGYV